MLKNRDKYGLLSHYGPRWPVLELTSGVKRRSNPERRIDLAELLRGARHLTWFGGSQRRLERMWVSRAKPAAAVAFAAALQSSFRGEYGAEFILEIRLAA
jgi:hypothetical protein